MKTPEDMFLFDSPHGDKSYWMKGDFSGYYAVWFVIIKPTDFEWPEIEDALYFLESSSIPSAREEALRVREKIKPYYQKVESQSVDLCLMNREV
jgi:hypothetical protein